MSEYITITYHTTTRHIHTPCKYISEDSPRHSSHAQEEDHKENRVQISIIIMTSYLQIRDTWWRDKILHNNVLDLMCKLCKPLLVLIEV